MFRSITTIVATLAVSGFVHAQDAVQWTQAEGGNGHWYQGILYPGSCTSIEATAAAESLGGYLVSLGTEAEDSWVRANPASDFSLWANSGIEGPWIGAINYQDAWEWTDGTPWSYENWWPGNPGECCPADVSLWEYDLGRLWQDHIQGVNQFSSYLVEWSADCNDDGIVDYGQILDGTVEDVNGNGIPDSCDLEGLSDPIQWPESEGGNGHWYAYVQSASPSCWETDREMAEDMGGYLATITNEAENNFLGQLAQPFYPLSAAANIGGYQDLEDPDYSEPGGAWKWVTGEPFEYTNWQGGEPGCCGPNEDWLDFNAQSSQWRDRVNCLPNEETTSQWSLIEWSDDCNGDGIVDYGQILDGELTDCDGNGVPDICELEELKMGACCLSGNCVVTTASNCFDAQGAYAGDDISCADANCPTTCSGDVNGDNQVGIVDLLTIIDGWGFCP